MSNFFSLSRGLQHNPPTYVSYMSSNFEQRAYQDGKKLLRVDFIGDTEEIVPFRSRVVGEQPLRDIWLLRFLIGYRLNVNEAGLSTCHATSCNMFSTTVDDMH
jgi:hypothetical protein